MKLFLLLFIGWNLITFLLMGVDKRRAVKEKDRISEKVLILCAFLMGGVGILVGMLVFHHKTQKLKFKVLVPVAIAVNALCVYGLWYANFLVW